MHKTISGKNIHPFFSVISAQIFIKNERKKLLLFKFNLSFKFDSIIYLILFSFSQLLSKIINKNYLKIFYTHNNK